MRTIDDPGVVRSWAAAERCAGRTVGLVPTMGALHAGHLALVDAMRAGCDRVVVSIFVNPLQFDESADFDSYPRPIDGDLETCRAVGVDVVYAPTASTMYPAGFRSAVVVRELSEPMEGRMRPGHFDGVTTVVTKLLTTVRPDRAIFGEKDYQQLAIIRRLAADLDLGVEIVGHPIVREPDGLALSSRNSRLDAAQRRGAQCIPRALDAAVARAAAPGSTVTDVVGAAIEVLDREPLASPEYVTVFDPATLAELDRLEGSARIATAVRIGDVRLIDNRSLADR